ncbi:MAG TPA: hypothetical protein VFC84_13635 [Desulfosporosinus sp.]|nr:hypothetical protein [Desulfosporosinus sp.]
MPRTGIPAISSGLRDRRRKEREARAVQTIVGLIYRRSKPSAGMPRPGVPATSAGLRD